MKINPFILLDLTAYFSLTYSQNIFFREGSDIENIMLLRGMIRGGELNFAFD